MVKTMTHWFIMSSLSWSNILIGLIIYFFFTVKTFALLQFPRFFTCSSGHCSVFLCVCETRKATFLDCGGYRNGFPTLVSDILLWRPRSTAKSLLSSVFLHNLTWFSHESRFRSEREPTHATE